MRSLRPDGIDERERERESKRNPLFRFKDIAHEFGFWVVIVLVCLYFSFSIVSHIATFLVTIALFSPALHLVILAAVCLAPRQESREWVRLTREFMYRQIIRGGARLKIYECALLEHQMIHAECRDGVCKNLEGQGQETLLPL